MRMLWNIYLRSGSVFIPTVAKTVDGFYMDVDPVEVISADDKTGVVTAIKGVVDKGNPLIPTPTRSAFPKPAVLKYAKVKTWDTFEKKASCWKLSHENGAFQLRSLRKDVEGGWCDDGKSIDTFSGPTAIDDLASAVFGEIESFSQNKGTT